MFSLIITLVSIALVAALAIATLYFGGDAMTKGDASARATQIVTQGQQVLAAADLFRADKGRWPASMQELVEGAYLKQVPTVTKSTIASAVGGSEWLAQAHAQAGAIAWEMPSAGRPTFVLASAVSAEVCQQVNFKGRGDNGILKTAYTSLSTQCFGDAVQALTVVVTRESDGLEQVLGAEKVTQGDAPGVEQDSSWLVKPGSIVAEAGPPSGPVQSPVEVPAGLGIGVEVDSSSWTFTTTLDTPVSKVFKLTNKGGATVTVDYEVVAGDGFVRQYQGPTDCYDKWRLNPGESCSIGVLFSPWGSASTVSSQVSVVIQDLADEQNTTTGSVPLSATVTDAADFAYPASTTGTVHLGSINFWESLDSPVMVFRNDTAQAFTVFGVTVTNQNDYFDWIVGMYSGYNAIWFAWEGTCLTQPTLQPGESCTYMVNGWGSAGNGLEIGDIVISTSEGDLAAPAKVSMNIVPPSLVDFGTVKAGETSGWRTITVKWREADATKVEYALIEFNARGQNNYNTVNRGDYEIRNDTCAGKTLNFGDTCTFEARAVGLTYLDEAWQPITEPMFVAASTGVVCKYYDDEMGQEIDRFYRGYTDVQYVNAPSVVP